MGAQAFVNEVKAKTPREGFSELVAEAVYDHGHDAYNGTISTCDIGRCTNRFAEPSVENRSAAYAFIEEVGFGEKWQADWIELGKDEKDGRNVYLFYGWASC